MYKCCSRIIFCNLSLVVASAYLDASAVEAAPVASPGFNRRSCHQGEPRTTANHHRGPHERARRAVNTRANTANTSGRHHVFRGPGRHQCKTVMKGLQMCWDFFFKYIGSACTTTNSVAAIFYIWKVQIIWRANLIKMEINNGCLNSRKRNTEQFLSKRSLGSQYVNTFKTISISCL